MFSFKHISKFGTTALTALILSACSSGGGSDNSNTSAPSAQSEQSTPSSATNNLPQQPSTTTPSQTVQESNVAQQSSTTTPSQIVPEENTAQQPPTPMPPTTSQNQLLEAQDVGFLIPKVEGAEIEILSPKTEATDLNVLNVEGKRINIIPAGMSSHDVLEITSNNLTRLISGTKYKNVRWGLIDQESLKNRYLLADGINPTTNMPTTGQATYVGKGVHSYASQGQGINTYHLSNTHFNVNFADKSLEGSITPANDNPFGNINEIKLAAKINGNQFSGKTSEETETAGRFYGNDANELAGSYLNSKANYLGVFGAQKQ